MSRSKIINQLKSLVINRENDPVAIHGTSVDFLNNLTSNDGKLQGSGFYENYLYIILKNQSSKNEELLESATFYAKVNAIKDLLFSLHPNFKELLLKYDLGHYRFALALYALAMNYEVTDDFKVFSEHEINQMQEVSRQVKEEDRAGVLVYFSNALISDYDIEIDDISFQARVIVDLPITINYITSIQLLGDYEINYFNNVICKK